MSPALAGSLALHVGLFVLVLILGMYFQKPPSLPGGVPVTIVSEGPPEFIDAPVADAPQEAQAEVIDPIPDEVLAESDPLPTPIPKPPPDTPTADAPAPTSSPPTISEPSTSAAAVSLWKPG